MVLSVHGLPVHSFSILQSAASDDVVMFSNFRETEFIFKKLNFYLSLLYFTCLFSLREGRKCFIYGYMASNLW